MRTQPLVVLSLVAIGSCAESLRAQPNVIVGEIKDTFPDVIDEGPYRWGMVDGVTGYSIPTTSCNVGDTNLIWEQIGSNHPVIAQNMYRIRDGAIEQIGMSWIKHGICAIGMDVCADCPDAPFECEDELDPGCSDPYSAFLNGAQYGMGTRSEVNVSTGEFPWPYTGQGGIGNATHKRIAVSNADLDPALNAGAVYLVEAEYVHPEDAAAGNNADNASYRLFEVGPPVIGSWELLWNDSVTERTKPAIFAWQDHGLGAGVPDPDVTLVAIDVADDGRFWIGYRVTTNGDGTWRYEYAIENLTSHRSGSSWTIPLGADVAVTNVGFHDIDYHSGDPYDNTDWSSEVSSTSVAWTSPEDFDANENTNALRWATLYNFRFDANTAPIFGTGELGLFRPGVPDVVGVTVMVPGDAGACAADCNQDDSLNIFDFLCFQGLVTTGDDAADCNADDAIDIFDFLCYQGLFTKGCP